MAPAPSCCRFTELERNQSRIDTSDTLIWIFGGLIVGSCCSWIGRRRKLKKKLCEQAG
ncbi:hypothetical protein [Brevibacterium oceani]|uniref:hypothetical protein n=1 Tax=Brevibacterium oceani TaxID=358099 RepID=UPI001B31B68D|nr:hypothetical protein [Brevibacterium oceani]